MIRSIGGSPPPAPPGPPSSTALSADGTAEPGATRSVLPRFARRSGVLAPMAFKHRNHRNIDPESAQQIHEMERRLDEASRSQRPGEVAGLVHELLDSPIFQATQQITVGAISNLFSALDKCPVKPNEEQLAKFSDEFIGNLVAFQKRYAPKAAAVNEEALQKRLRDFLKSNRSTKAEFQIAAGRLVQRYADSGSARRGSAQKMALETFEATFSSGRLGKTERLDALKKLVDILPNLTHHEIAERNPQRRGLKLFEKLVDRLPPDEAAEMLAYLMNTVSSLSQKLSRRQANFKDVGGLAVEATSYLVSAGTIPALMFMVPLAAVGAYLPIPMAVAAGGFAAARYLGIKKQPQGSALYILQNQLVKLRGRWSRVSPDKQNALIGAFNALRLNFAQLAGTKRSTLERFFNSELIDPSRFPADPSPVGELGRRLHHRLIAPITSRMEPPELGAGTRTMSIPGYADATDDQKRLVNLLHDFHVEAKTAIDSDFLVNFIEKTSDPGFENAAAVVRTVFSRVKQMAEYKNTFTREALLQGVVEMTKRLCDGDTEFVHAFVSAATLAGADCHNNARQIFQALQNAVIIDKARKGEEGLDRESALVKLGRGMFHDGVLKKLSAEAREKTNIGPAFEVEVGHAVQISLGKEFGIPNVVQGMGYTGAIKKEVTPEFLEGIRKSAREEATDEKFLQYLMTWDPLTEKLKASPSFKEELERKTAKARENYEAAEDGVMEGTRTEEEFNAAAFEFQHATKATENALLEARIKDLVAADSAGTLLDDDTPMAPSGLDDKAWKSFVEKLHDLPRSSTPDEAGTEDFQESTLRQFNVPPLLSNSAIERDDMPAQVMPTEGGGDCLFHALNIPSDEIGQMRKNVADAIREEAGDIEYLGRNALNVLQALSQTPATQHIADHLMTGREAVSSEAYARLVEMRGIYAGFDELRLLSTLPEYRDKTIVVIDNDGTISTYRNGNNDPESCTPDRKNEQLRQAISGADIALYKTPGHWERIDLTSVAGPSRIE